MSKKSVACGVLLLLHNPALAQVNAPEPEEIPESVTVPQTEEEAIANATNDDNGRIVNGYRAHAG